jgi:hypothetical protein
MKHDIYVVLVNRLNDDPLTFRCPECKILIGALTSEALEKAKERHKCKLTRSEKADRIIKFVRENP